MTHPLTAYRKRNGLTLEAFGKLVGAAKGTVSKWEAGDAMPRRPALGKIADATENEVTANDFMMPREA